MPPSPNRQIRYPLDQQSKEALSRAVDDILTDKVFDLLWKKILVYQTNFESGVGFDRSNTTQVGVLTDGSAMRVKTTATSGNEQWLLKFPENMLLYTFGTRSSFRTEISLSTTDTDLKNVTMRLLAGDDFSTFNYYGFKVVGNVLYGVSRKSTGQEASVVLNTSDSDGKVHKDQVYRVEARYLPTKSVTFFVDGTASGTISGSANIPDNNLESPVIDILFVDIITSDNVAKWVDLSYYQYQQGMNPLLVN